MRLHERSAMAMLAAAGLTIAACAVASWLL
jgi:hypothetical protein